jgi:aryl-alcohol dehydrogenase-like predicted oxidoreductase
MKYRTLGKTGLKVSEIGMGTWQLANDPGFWVGADLKESYRSLFRFVELGGNFIDTAWIYGHSDDKPDKHPSEELIGKFLGESKLRDKLIIATKIPGKNMKWPARKGISISEVFPNNWIEKCVNDSLRSLGTETIDLMQFHVWQDNFVDEDGWKEMIQKITKAGKVRFWGISANDYQPSNCISALDTGLISTVQVIFNLFHQLPIKRLFPYAKSKNIGLIVRVPLDEGSLAGKFTQETRFNKDELRYTFFAGERLKEVVKRTDALKKLLGKDAKTLSELALRFILSFPEISTTIPGLRRIRHVEENVSVSDGKTLSKDLLKKLEEHVWERNFYSGDALDPSLEESGYMEV